MQTVDLHSLWSLKKQQDAPPSMFVNYIPNFPDENLRNAFYNRSYPHETFAEFGLCDSDAVDLLNEVAATPEYQLAVSSLPQFGSPYIYKHSISRRVDDRWLATTVQPNSLSVTLEPRLGSQQLEHVDFNVPLSQLSGSSRGTVRKFDAGTRRIAHARFASTHAELAGADAIPLPTPTPEQVFISYRRLDGIGIAKLVHSELERYAYGTRFRPFLDLHDLQRGDWEATILDALERSQVFMPVLTTEYAVPGSYSAKELEIACERLTNGEMSCIPIFIPTSKSGHASTFSKFQSCEAATTTALGPDFVKQLATVARS